MWFRMVNVSLILPGIRTNNWYNFYQSALEACKEFSFELVIVSPFDLPKELVDLPYKNIKLIKDYGCPSRATQLAVLNAEGEFIYNCVDDGLFFQKSIDYALNYCYRFDYMDILNMRYREQQGGSGTQLPFDFWYAWYHDELRLPGIKREWKISLHFLMRKALYLELGGVDCQFEYVNHGAHDLMFRIQELGGKIYDSSIEGLNCEHMPGISGDHKPIHDAQISHDKPIFDFIYQNPNAAKERLHLNLHNWKDSPEIWTRRFDPNNLPTKYEDLLK